MHSACKALKRLAPREQRGDMAMIRGSFTELDFSDGDIVFFDVAKCGDRFCGPQYEKMVRELTPTVMAMRKGATFISTQAFLPIKPDRTVVAECRRAPGDTYKAAERDARFSERLCGMTYSIYTMPGKEQGEAAPAKPPTLACHY